MDFPQPSRRGHIVQTLPELVYDLTQAPLRAVKGISEVIRAGAFAIQRVAAEKAPVDTGFLKSSITVGHPSGRDLSPGDIEAVIGPEADYGVFVEFGTSKMGAQPYMTPAVEQVAPRIESALAAIAEDF